VDRCNKTFNTRRRCDRPDSVDGSRLSVAAFCSNHPEPCRSGMNTRRATRPRRAPAGSGGAYFASKRSGPRWCTARLTTMSDHNATGSRATPADTGRGRRPGQRWFPTARTYHTNERSSAPGAARPGDHLGTTRHAHSWTTPTSAHRPPPHLDQAYQRERLARSSGGQVCCLRLLTPTTDTDGPDIMSPGRSGPGCPRR
jgi:hypothetical protein